jgi:hypothetical protein
MGLDFTSNSKKKEIKELYDFNKDFEKIEAFIFHFWPIIELNESKQNTTEQDEDDQIVSKMMSQASSSLSVVQQDDIRKQTNLLRSQSLALCNEYLMKLLKFDQEEFEEDFQKHRDSVFLPAAENLFFINKSGNLNGFNMQLFSLPIEHNLHVNYWAYQVVKLHLADSLKTKLV